MKNLIIGGMFGYNIPQVSNWVNSINATVDSPTSDKVIICGNTSDDTIQWLQSQGFITIHGQLNGMAPHVARFLYIFEYLYANWHKYKYVVSTDIRDIIFQDNPFTWLEHNLLPGKKLVASSEGIKYKDEDWGNQNLLQTYGSYIHEKFKDNEIYNVGVLAGESEYIKDLVFNVITNAVNRPIPVVDQAVYNVLIQTCPYKDVVQFMPHDSNWACQLGTTAAHERSFKHLLVCDEPELRDGIFYTKAGSDQKYTVVHQYDRIDPDWRAKLP